MMDPDFRRRLLHALRSGEYKQGTGKQLRDENDCFCFAGVVCDLIDPEKWTTCSEGYAYGTYRVAWPDTVQRKSGIPPKIFCQFVSMNDRGKTFTQIAQRIEDYL